MGQPFRMFLDLKFLDLRINILDHVQDFVTLRCQISHVVVPKQQNGSPNQQMVISFQHKMGTRKYKMGCANYMGWRYAWSSCAAWHFLDTKVLLLQIISNSNLRCWDLNPSLNVCTYTPKNVLCNNVEFRKSFEAKNSDIPFVKAQDWHFICVTLPGQSPVEATVFEWRSLQKGS